MALDDFLDVHSAEANAVDAGAAEMERKKRPKTRSWRVLSLP
ncbi:hypothetical protein [Arthrobacter sp. Marseille-P9274]|nr:hypothetical protein [Arthrobacter sp. Marseille-P9274]